MVFSSMLAEYPDSMTVEMIKQFYNFYIFDNFLEYMVDRLKSL